MLHLTDFFNLFTGVCQLEHLTSSKSNVLTPSPRFISVPVKHPAPGRFSILGHSGGLAEHPEEPSEPAR